MGFADLATRLLAAAFNFALCGACLYYISIASREIRWSRSCRWIVTRDPEPAPFWTRFFISCLAALVSLAIGILMLVPAAHPAPPPVQGPITQISPAH
jgi:hypothetical protein